MNRYLLLFVLIFSLLACNLGTAQQIDDSTRVTQAYQSGAFPIETILNIQHIFEQGQELGNRADVFSKVGDSITVSRHFMYPLGIGQYDLENYSHLETIISFYSQTNAHTGNSFVNESLAAGEGWSANAVLSSNYADEFDCLAGETPLFCEYRVVRPSIAIIMFGTNDTGYRTPEQFTDDIQSIISFTQELGIIPILSTIPNRPDVEQRVLLFNDIVRQLANSNHLPLIELYNQTVNLPNYGLTSDLVHPSAPPDGLTASFNSMNLQYGYTVRNLSTLEILDSVYRVIYD